MFMFFPVDYYHRRRIMFIAINVVLKIIIPNKFILQPTSPVFLSIQLNIKQIQKRREKSIPCQYLPPESNSNAPFHFKHTVFHLAMNERTPFSHESCWFMPTALWLRVIFQLKTANTCLNSSLSCYWILKSLIKACYCTPCPYVGVSEPTPWRFRPIRFCFRL